MFDSIKESFFITPVIEFRVLPCIQSINNKITNGFDKILAQTKKKN